MSTGKTGECLVTLQAFNTEWDSERRQNDENEDRRVLQKYLSFSIPQDLKAPPLFPPLFFPSPPFLLTNVNPPVDWWWGLVFVEKSLSPVKLFPSFKIFTTLEKGGNILIMHSAFSSSPPPYLSLHIPSLFLFASSLYLLFSLSSLLWISLMSEQETDSVWCKLMALLCFLCHFTQPPVGSHTHTDTHSQRLSSF